MRILLITLFTFISLSAHAADSCTSVEIDTTHMPENNNQSGLNWCFAWTATDLLSYYEKEQLSAYDLALQYHNHPSIRDESVENYTDVGGNDGAALLVALTGKGMCLEKDTNYTNGDWGKLSDLMVMLADPNKDLIEIICSNDLRNSLPFKNIPIDIINILNRLEADKKVAGIFDVTCSERYKFKNKYGVGTQKIEDTSSAVMMKKLDDLLSKNSPASITYDVDLIMNGPNYKKQEANHSSTIIGRRRNFWTRKCEYLIKNSWGDHCPKKSKIKCDKGNYWVPQSTLENNIYEISWLVKR